MHRLFGGLAGSLLGLDAGLLLLLGLFGGLLGLGAKLVELLLRFAGGLLGLFPGLTLRGLGRQLRLVRLGRLASLFLGLDAGGLLGSGPGGGGFGLVAEAVKLLLGIPGGLLGRGAGIGLGLTLGLLLGGQTLGGLAGLLLGLLTGSMFRLGTGGGSIGLGAKLFQLLLGVAGGLLGGLAGGLLDAEFFLFLPRETLGGFGGLGFGFLAGLLLGFGTLGCLVGLLAKLFEFLLGLVGSLFQRAAGLLCRLGLVFLLLLDALGGLGGLGGFFLGLFAGLLLSLGSLGGLGGAVAEVVELLLGGEGFGFGFGAGGGLDVGLGLLLGPKTLDDLDGLLLGLLAGIFLFLGSLSGLGGRLAEFFKLLLGGGGFGFGLGTDLALLLGPGSLLVLQATGRVGRLRLRLHAGPLFLDRPAGGVGGFGPKAVKLRRLDAGVYLRRGIGVRLGWCRRRGLFGRCRFGFFLRRGFSDRLGRRFGVLLLRWLFVGWFGQLLRRRCGGVGFGVARPLHQRHGAGASGGFGRRGITATAALAGGAGRKEYLVALGAAGLSAGVAFVDAELLAALALEFHAPLGVDEV